MGEVRLKVAFRYTSVAHVLARLSKGNRVNIPEPGRGYRSGNTSELGDVSGSLGKSSLFLLTVCQPWNRITRR